MSRQQWGHGYWQGVEGGINGVERRNIERTAKSSVLALCKFQNGQGEWEPMELHKAETVLKIAGVLNVDAILNFIWHNEPFGAYIGGTAGENLDMQNDCICLPRLSDKELIKAYSTIKAKEQEQKGAEK